jgi:hypothetical protein
MFNGHDTFPADARAVHRTNGKRGKRLLMNLAGMGSEILFSCGLILIGFLISLLSGW